MCGYIDSREKGVGWKGMVWAHGNQHLSVILFSIPACLFTNEIGNSAVCTTCIVYINAERHYKKVSLKKI